MAAQSASDIQADLDSTRQAIRDCIQLQSYSKPGLSVNRAQLSELRKLEKDLMRRLARATGSGPLVLSETNAGESI